MLIVPPPQHILLVFPALIIPSNHSISLFCTIFFCTIFSHVNCPPTTTHPVGVSCSHHTFQPLNFAFLHYFFHPPLISTPVRGSLAVYISLFLIILNLFYTISSFLFSSVHQSSSFGLFLSGFLDFFSALGFPLQNLNFSLLEPFLT